MGLATDRETFTLPCCRESLLLRIDSEPSALRVRPGGAPIVVRPASREVRAGSLRLQVAALRDELQAAELARSVSNILGVEGQSVFDAGTGLYRVRVGQWSERVDAEQARRKLDERGIAGAWIVTEGAAMVDPAFDLTQGDRSRRLSGRTLIVETESNEFRFDNRVFRGRLVLHLSRRGGLNVIDELSVDDYLRGVLPMEMGPEPLSSARGTKGARNRRQDLCDAQSQ